MLIKNRIFIILLMNILFVGSLYPQRSKLLLSVEKEINSGKHRGAVTHLKELNVAKLSTVDKAYYNYLMATGLEKNNEEDKAFPYYLKAKKIYLAIDSIEKAMDINLQMAFLISAQKNTTDNYKQYIEEYIAHAQKLNNTKRLGNGYLQLGILKMDEGRYGESRSIYKKALAYAQEAKDGKLESVINNNLAALYNESLKKPDSALYYFVKDLDYIKQGGNTEDLCYNYINQAASYYYLGNHHKAIEMLELADNLPIKDYTVRTKQYIYEFLYKNYDALGDCNNAYKYLQLNKQFADKISLSEQNIAINDIQTKYHTKEKEVENLKLKSSITRNRILLYTSIGLLLASLIIAFLIFKNARRKEKISSQEKQIEQQKLDKALKDYELNSIDMMLEGQDKERQRIADDLHDNLGSMLAALKLNFENLKLRNSELRDEETKLYERTDELIEEAYQKVRRLAHAKNAGVLANEGLIPALKKLADKISIPGKLQIHVIPFGFDERIENKLEIAIFRMVQELATNIIKHSQASEATVHLTHHEQNINLIIEDNGVGFDPATLGMADGMGLASIKKKAAQLGGSFTIDSTPGKGTTILIDIPV